jgi:hypothetical protein
LTLQGKPRFAIYEKPLTLLNARWQRMLERRRGVKGPMSTRTDRQNVIIFRSFLAGVWAKRMVDAARVSTIRVNQSFYVKPRAHSCREGSLDDRLMPGAGEEEVTSGALGQDSYMGSALRPNRDGTGVPSHTHSACPAYDLAVSLDTLHGDWSYYCNPIPRDAHDSEGSAYGGEV